MENTMDEKLARIKDALRALGEVQTSDEVENLLLKGICHAINAYRMYLGGKR